LKNELYVIIACCVYEINISGSGEFK